MSLVNDGQQVFRVAHSLDYSKQFKLWDDSSGIITESELLPLKSLQPPDCLPTHRLKQQPATDDFATCESFNAFGCAVDWPFIMSPAMRSTASRPWQLLAAGASSRAIQESLPAPRWFLGIAE